jgi:hypothetical protein
LTKELEKYNSWSDFPRLCLLIASTYPYILETIKLDTLRWEFYIKKNENQPDHPYKDEKYFGAYAALLSEFVRTAQAASEKIDELWFCGFMGPNDHRGVCELL